MAVDAGLPKMITEICKQSHNILHNNMIFSIIPVKAAEIMKSNITTVDNTQN
jgi:hypothetical protein